MLDNESSTIVKTKMKALCVKQPYASWIADGKKTIETRTWRTNFRDKFLVVASRDLDRVRKLELDPTEYPIGMALATARIVDCRPMTKEDEQAACCKLYPRAWAWLLADISKIKLFSVKGRLNFFQVRYTSEDRT
jgi:hypothetical protein